MAAENEQKKRVKAQQTNKQTSEADAGLDNKDGKMKTNQNQSNTESDALEMEKQAHLDCERELLDVKETLEQERKKLAEITDSALRMQADFENYRKRNLDSVRKAREDGAEEVITAVLPLSDIMDQAIGMISDSNVAMGVKMIKRQLLDILAGLGVSEYDPTGQQFDPALHNAVGRKVADGAEAGTVIEVMNKGYIKGDKVIRHANVVIAEG